MKKAFGIILLGLIVLLSSCTTGEYARMMERELATGERNDSLFLGIFLGMHSKEFYRHCWELNQKQVLKSSGSTLSIQHDLTEGVSEQVRMNFYPSFFQNRVYEVSVEFCYDKWAPWNKELFADSLMPEILTLFEDWYGGEFVKLEHPSKGEAYVKMDGNRRIIVWKRNDQFVGTIMTDMLVEPKVKEFEKKKKEAPKEQNRMSTEEGA
jgi:hypothetical protein